MNAELSILPSSSCSIRCRRPHAPPPPHLLPQAAQEELASSVEQAAEAERRASESMAQLAGAVQGHSEEAQGQLTRLRADLRDASATAAAAQREALAMKQAVARAKFDNAKVRVRSKTRWKEIKGVSRFLAFAAVGAWSLTYGLYCPLCLSVARPLC